MNIEFTVEDYFNELQVMENYYGQEEELYPWMYMLLQMIELKKKSILKEDYNRLCIIDVHVHKKSDNDSRLKKIIQKKVPDFVFIDPSSDSLCGCVEIKKITPNKRLELPVGIFYINIIKYSFTIDSTLKNETSKIPYDLSKTEDYDNVKTKICKQILSTEIPELNLKPDSENISYSRLGSSRIEGSLQKHCHVDISIPTSMDAQTIILEHHNSDSKNISFTNKDQKEITSNLSITRTETVGSWDSTNGPELVQHLRTSKKVLYTDGLVFYYITFVESKIRVEKIADLTKCYSSACKTTCFASMTSSERLSAYAEWDKLIAGLTAIDWHHAPITKID